MPHEIDVDFQQDLPSYLNALEQYNIQYGPKSQNLQGQGGQNFQVRTSDFAPGYGYVNPQNNELFPLYPETGGFEQPNPGLPHPDPLGEPPRERYTRLPYYVPYAGGDIDPNAPGPVLDEYGRDMSLSGTPYQGHYGGGDSGNFTFGFRSNDNPGGWFDDQVTDWPVNNPGYGVYAGGDEF